MHDGMKPFRVNSRVHLMSLLFLQRARANSTVPNLKSWRKKHLGLVVLVLTALSSPVVVTAVTTPSVAPGVTPSVLYYHPDATGNLIAMTDGSGQVAWRAELRPFGLGTANPQNSPPRFLDQPLDAEIGAEGGLYHLGARTYDPVAGRFLTTDPLPLLAIPREEPQRFDRYAYGLNNPYRYMDPTGLQADPKDIEERIRGPVQDPAEPRKPYRGPKGTYIGPNPLLEDDPSEEVTDPGTDPGTKKFTAIEPARPEITIAEIYPYGEVPPPGFPMIAGPTAPLEVHLKAAGGAVLGLLIGLAIVSFPPIAPLTIPGLVTSGLAFGF